MNLNNQPSSIWYAVMAGVMLRSKEQWLSDARKSLERHPVFPATAQQCIRHARRYHKMYLYYLQHSRRYYDMRCRSLPS
jgi:hypothetical protein